MSVSSRASTTSEKMPMSAAERYTNIPKQFWKNHHGGFFDPDRDGPMLQERQEAARASLLTHFRGDDTCFTISQGVDNDEICVIIIVRDKDYNAVRDLFPPDDHAIKYYVEGDVIHYPARCCG